MNDTHWGRLQQRWSRLRPPLRPNDEVVAAMETALGAAARGTVLLLGVTPELADIGARLIACDNDARMIAGNWPGNDARRQALRADWLQLPLAAGAIDGVIGDGSLSMFDYPAGYRACFASLAHVLAPGGRLAIRLYRRPDEAESVAAVCAAATAQAIENFHAFKWRFAMALVAAAGTPNVAVADIHAAFVRAFPARGHLASLSGWPRADIDTIDSYAHSAARYSFPNAAELLATIPSSFGTARFVDSGCYPLAERCPLLVLERRP